jgi:hypothetical protein
LGRFLGVQYRWASHPLTADIKTSLGIALQLLFCEVLYILNGSPARARRVVAPVLRRCCDGAAMVRGSRGSRRGNRVAAPAIGRGAAAGGARGDVRQFTNLGDDKARRSLYEPWKGVSAINYLVRMAWCPLSGGRVGAG